MQRSRRDVPQEASEKFDISPLLRALMYLDECMKRGVVIGVYEDSREVSDEDVRKALTNVNALLDTTKIKMDALAKTLTAFQAPKTLQ